MIAESTSSHSGQAARSTSSGDRGAARQAAGSRPTEQDAAGYRWLFVFGLISLVLLLLGGWLTYLGLGPWYKALEFPPYQPPAWLFTPVWTVVLGLLAVATWQVSRSADRRAYLAFGLYGAQCVLNAGWSLLFFTLQRPDAALVELLVLDVLLVLMILAYARVRGTAGLLLAPYLLWLLFATAINGWIVAYNPAFS